MNKKAKYKKLAKKTLRECLKIKEYTYRGVLEQISSLKPLVSGDLETMKDSKELENYMKEWCPFFANLKEKEDVFGFWQIVKKLFEKEYKKLTKNKKKYTAVQTINLLTAMECFWSYTELQNDVRKKMKKFSKCKKLAAKVYFAVVEEEVVYDICK